MRDALVAGIFLAALTAAYFAYAIATMPTAFADAGLMCPCI